MGLPYLLTLLRSPGHTRPMSRACALCLLALGACFSKPTFQGGVVDDARRDGTGPSTLVGDLWQHAMSNGRFVHTVWLARPFAQAKQLTITQ